MPKLTYRDLLAKLNTLSEKMLDDEITVYNGDTELFCEVADVDTYSRDDLLCVGDENDKILIISISEPDIGDYE